MSNEETQPKKLVREGLSHTTALVGIGALLLYALGIFETIGQLRASDVSVRHGLSIIPLDRHLRNGIGVITSPASIVLALTLGVGYLFSRWIRDAMAISVTPGQSITIEDWQIPPAMLKLGRIAIGLSFAWVALTAPWPWLVPVAVFATVVLFLNARFRRFLRDGHFHRAMRWPERSLSLLAGAAVFAAAFDAYVRANPLPDAEIRERSGVTRGPLIAHTESLIFVGDPGGVALHREVPISRALTVRVTERERPNERSLLQILGLE